MLFQDRDPFFSSPLCYNAFMSSPMKKKRRIYYNNNNNDKKNNHDDNGHEDAESFYHSVIYLIALYVGFFAIHEM